MTLDFDLDIAAMMATDIRNGENAVIARTREADMCIKTNWRVQTTGAGFR